MAGTRTAPTVDGLNPTELAVTISFIDFSGDVRSVRYVLPDTATDAQIEAVVDATQSNSNASIWRVNVQTIYAGAQNASNAVNQTYPSVYDNVVGLFKESALISQQGYIPAPEGVLIPSGDVVDTSNTDYQAWRDAILAMLAGSYSAQSVRFTERREKNDSVPA